MKDFDKIVKETPCVLVDFLPVGVALVRLKVQFWNISSQNWMEKLQF